MRTLTILSIIFLASNMGAQAPILPSNAFQDFDPPSVIKYGCVGHKLDYWKGAPNASDRVIVWEAVAWASHKEPRRWMKPIGEFPFTDAGEVQAKAICTEWIAQADAKVAAVKP